VAKTNLISLLIQQDIRNHMAAKKTKKNPQDATLRNIRALKKEVKLIWERLREMNDVYAKHVRAGK